MKKIIYSPGEPSGIGPDLIIKLSSSKLWEDLKIPIVSIGDPKLFIERAALLKKKIRGWNFKIWELSRFTKTWILMFFDFIALFVTLWASFALRFSDIWPKLYLENNSTLFFVTPILGITLFYWLY